MASEPLNIFQDLNLKKSLKYISFEQASIFLRSKEEKIILQRAIQILDQGRSVDDEAPPKYTLVDTQRYSMQMFLTNRQEEDLKSCERRAQERIEVYEDALKCGRPPKKPLPWFATEVPRELRRIQEGLPRELCTILQLTYLENNSQRVTGLADGKDNLQYLSDSDETRNVNPLAAQKQAILVTLGKCKITSKNTTPAVRGLLGALVSQFRSGKQFYGFESSQLSLNTGSCASCLEEFESKVCTLTCRHTYCLPCVAKFAKITLNNEYLWPAKCCQQEIPRILLEQALSSSELRILRTREKEFAVPVDQRFYCTKPKCGKFFIPVKTGDGTACPHCKFKMCTHCRSPQHKPDVSCLQDKNIQALVAEGTLEEWCTCPRCYRWIELVGDCP